MKNKKIKVCFVSLKAYQLFNQKIKSTFGGAEVQMRFLSRELAKDKRYQVNLIVGDYGQQKKEKIEKVILWKFLNFDDSNIVKAVWISFNYFLLLKKINADIYFTTTAGPSIGIIAIFCKLTNKKHIHRTASDVDVDGIFIKKNGLNGKLYKYGLQKADVVLTQSLDHKKKLIKNHGINSIIIKNSFVFNEEKKSKKYFTLWVSRCHPLKKPELFLDLAKNFKDEKFKMICPSSSGQEGFYKKIKNNTKNIKNLEFIEFVSFAEIQKYYNEAKILVNTSDYEGFPNTFIQAGIGNVPILSLNVNPDNFIKNYNCGYFAEGNFDLLKKQFSGLLKNEKTWKEKSKNINKYVINNHNMENNIQKINKIIVAL